VVDVGLGDPVGTEGYLAGEAHHRSVDRVGGLPGDQGSDLVRRHELLGQDLAVGQAAVTRPQRGRRSEGRDLVAA
jgi:hypothetical protein